MAREITDREIIAQQLPKLTDADCKYLLVTVYSLLASRSDKKDAAE